MRNESKNFQIISLLVFGFITIVISISIVITALKTALNSLLFISAAIFLSGCLTIFLGLIILKTKEVKAYRGRVIQGISCYLFSIALALTGSDIDFFLNKWLLSVIFFIAGCFFLYKGWKEFITNW